MLWRAAMMAAAAAAAGVELGRRAARRAVEKEAAEATAAAIAEARARIAEEARRIAARTLRRFAVSTLLKSAIALALFGAAQFGWLTPLGFSALFGVAVALFFARDLYLLAPVGRLVFAELGRSGWRPRSALADYAARQVETEAMARAEATELDWRARIALALAGRDKRGVAGDVAAAAAAALRETTWRDLRPILLAAAVKLIGGSALYAGFIALLLSAV